MVELIIGRGFFHIEVVESNVCAEKGDGAFDGRGVSDHSVRLQELREMGSFEEGGKEEVPLEVGKGKELDGRGHRKVNFFD